jgi:hypothetical protein
MNDNRGINPFLLLPFEVHYRSIPFREFTLYSKTEHPKKLSDLVCVREWLGYSYDESFKCDQNTGSELICCLLGQHDEVMPDWLHQLPHEGDEKWMRSIVFSLGIKESSATFTEILEKDLRFDLADCFEVANLLVFENSSDEEHLPTFILDASGSRLEVNHLGQIANTSSPEFGREVFDIDSLWDIEIDECSTIDLDDIRISLINNCLKLYYPTRGAEIEELTVR